MAESYPFPNWIRAPDIAQEFARGVTIGQQAAQEQQRLQMQQEENQRAHLMEQQRLEVDKAYKDQQLAMQKQELDQATKLNALRIQGAAQALDEQSKFRQHVAAGGDFVEGLLKYGRGLGITGPGYAQLVKEYQEQKHPFVPSETTADTGEKIFETSRGHYRVISPPKVTAAELPKDHLVDGKLIRSFPDGTTKQIYPPLPPDKKQSFGILDTLGQVAKIAGMGAAPLASMGKKPAAKETPTSTEEKKNPYKVGARYGDLRYKGGDPNDEASWEPVK